MTDELRDMAQWKEAIRIVRALHERYERPFLDADAVRLRLHLKLEASWGGRSDRSPSRFSHGVRRSWQVAAALLIVIGAISVAWSGVPRARVAHGRAAEPETTFLLDVPAAQRVALVGDFNAWDTTATALTRDSVGGKWRVRVRVRPGVHTYAFVVDGTRWTVDPLAPRGPDDGFGAENSLLLVPST
ncbi:MAG: isoamylase early set domain-containing protein [Gemmatimonadaceae bacterium]